MSLRISDFARPNDFYRCFLIMKGHSTRLRNETSKITLGFAKNLGVFQPEDL